MIILLFNNDYYSCNYYTMIIIINVMKTDFIIESH